MIYPHKPATAAKREAAGPAFKKIIEDYQVDMVAIGNGTASRESELFVAEQLKAVKRDVFYVIVNEAGLPFTLRVKWLVKSFLIYKSKNEVRSALHVVCKIRWQN